MTLVELCAGTAALSLYALGGPAHRPPPLVGYMGSKRRLASQLAELLGVDRERPERVVLVDAGPWGDTWSTLRDRDQRRAVVALLRSWNTYDPHGLWETLVSWMPPSDPVWRAAQYLWLQARSAGTIPIWWNAALERWESPTGARTELGHQRGGMDARLRGTHDDRAARGLQRAHQKSMNGPHDVPSRGAPRRGSRAPDRPYEASGLQRMRALRGGIAVQKGSQRHDGNPHSLAGPVQVDSSARKTSRVLELQADGGPAVRWRSGCRGIQYPETVARRLEDLDALPWERVEVLHCRVEDVDPIPGAVVYFDPPYHGCPRYAALMDRALVLDVAERHAAAECHVLVSEGEPLPLDGWTAHQLPARKPEWVTASWTLSAAVQLHLF